MISEPNSVNEDVYLLKEPVLFKLKVDDELLDAQIVSVKDKYEYENEDDAYDYEIIPYRTQLFTIKFSNGHVDEYYIYDEEVYVDREQDEDKYTNALKVEICFPLEFWTSSFELRTLFWPIDGKETNIWIYRIDVICKEDYFVEYNGDYRFSVKFEDEQWTALTIRQVNPDPIDEALAGKVISLLKYYHGQASSIVEIPNPYERPKKPRSKCGYAEGYVLKVPITFIITVNGELLHARIESVRYEYMGYEDDIDTWYDINWFKIKFSNGHEDEYMVDDDEVCTDKGQDIYTNALHKEVCGALADWRVKRIVYTLGWPINGIETNIWVCRVDCFSDCEYFVKYNGDYRFSVRFENDQWITVSVRIKEPEIIDQALAKKVIAMLKHYHKKVV